MANDYNEAIAVDHKQKKKRKNRRKKSFLGYLLLFIIVFIFCLVGFSHFVKSYSPDVDVSIGNVEEMTLSESDMEFEIKSIDERLRWIKMEDEMPSVAVRTTEENEARNKLIEKQKEKKDKKEKKEKKSKIEDEVSTAKVDILRNDYKKSSPVKIELSDVIKDKVDFRKQEVKPIVPLPTPSMTKVYLGYYSSLEEAMSVQEKIVADFPEIAPFLKNVGGSYMVQLSSFSKQETANLFVERVRAKGYNPKIMTTN